MKVTKLIFYSLIVLILSMNKIFAQTVVSIKGNQFYINGKPTYPGRTWNGNKIEGLLMNSRMVQGIFDDQNPESANNFVYPDTKKWDAGRNNREFVENMLIWKSYGLNCFTLNMQGGSPTGYGVSKCLNTGFNPDGSLMEPYMKRLDNILKKADELQMVVILGIFYFGQDQYLKDETAIKNATNNLINWLFEKGYRNVLIEIANETNFKSYDHNILKPDQIHELINLVKKNTKKGYRYLVGTSFWGIEVPTSNVVKASDFLLIHGNGAEDPKQIQKLIDDTRKVEGYRLMPVVNNEDDHYNFDKEVNNFTISIKNYVSWGYFDFRFNGETDYKEGYQSVPVDWGISSERKKAFFNKVKEITCGNPVFKGWYADPEATVFDDSYWIYPTYSSHYEIPDTSAVFTDWQINERKNDKVWAPYLMQTFFNAFSSKDLVNWEKHSHVLDIKDISWAAYSLWAPSIIKKDNKYFLFFGANDIKTSEQKGGIGIAVSDNPAGPFKDYLGKPLINDIVNGAQPIDQFIFRDKNNKYYLIYGGWRHCNIVQIKDDFTGLIPYADGSIYKEITPESYVEGPFMFIRKGKYYLMWSEGDWTGPDYSVAYAIADSPFGPFKRVDKILQQDSTIAKGAGHHSIINIPNTDDWYIVYHRRPLTTKDGNHRETCIDRMYFDEKGFIKPVKITTEGVGERLLK